MTVVFLQAGVCDLRMWRQQMTAVADAGYQAIAFDRRGDGETTSEDAMLSHVEDLEDLLCELGIGATVPFGSPQGDRIAIDLARASLGEEIEPPDATTRVDSITQPLVLVSGELDISHIVERRNKPEATLPLKFLSALFSKDQSLDDQ